MLLIPIVIAGAAAALLGLGLWIWAIRLNDRRRDIKRKMLHVANTPSTQPVYHRQRRVSKVSVEAVEIPMSPTEHPKRESCSISIPDLEQSLTKYTPMIDKEELYLALRHSVLQEGMKLSTNHIPFNPLSPSLGMTLKEVSTRDCMQITSIEPQFDHRYPGVRVGDFVIKIDGILVTCQDEIDAALDDAIYMKKNTVALLTCNEIPVLNDSKNRRQSRSTALGDSHSFVDIESFKSIDDKSHKSSPHFHYAQLTPEREEAPPFRKVSRTPRRYHHDNAFSSIASSDMPVV